MDRVMQSEFLAEVQVDEAIADAQAALAGAGLDAERAGGLFGIPTGWLVLIALVIGAVAAMLLILAGHARRNRHDDARDDAFFGDQYALMDDEVEDDGFAAIEIGEARDEPVYEQDDTENVVPLRQAEPEELSERPFAATQREDVPRYAFAGAAGRPDGSTPSSGTMLSRHRPASKAPATPAPSGASHEASHEVSHEASHEGWGASRHAGGGGAAPDRDGPRHSSHDDDAPFIAPYIRDDIERSERRQADRIEGLREEVTRQLGTLRQENASRLDLFVGTVDRKLQALEGGGLRGGVGEETLRSALDGTAATLSRRVDRLSDLLVKQDERVRAALRESEERLERRLGTLGAISSDLHGVADAVTGSATAIRALQGDMDQMREQVERLERSLLDRAAQDGSARISLAEVVRGTLPEGTYSFDEALGRGEPADCVIRLEGREERIAIDASFPMSAFTQLPSRDAVRRNLPQAKQGEDQFRRAILRAILEAGDRCIVPGETTDSCLLFLPSEAAYTILHERFGDLVRDSQRARVWLTSPSTLMGTLNLLRNLMPRAEHGEERQAEGRVERQGGRSDHQRQHEAAALREEIEQLRGRASSLASELDRTRGALSELVETTERLSSDEAQAGDDEGYGFTRSEAWHDEEDDHEGRPSFR